MPLSIFEDPRKVYSVAEVTGDLKSLIEDSFGSVWISGQISNFKISQSGHAYFSLKDSDAQIQAVIFRPSLRNLKFEMEDGLSVIVHAKLTVYEPRGQYQLIVDHAEPQGLGALQLAFEQLKAKLAEEGLFDAKHKKPIPYFPKSIGIVTSSTGAVIHDLFTVLRRRAPQVDLVLYPVKVQGAGASQEIAAAIEWFNAENQVDVLIVGRGGGSLEDLWAFNEEPTIRAIANSKIPLISAVGHETDYTLADLAADLRAPTPSAAAELCVPLWEELSLSVSQLRERLVSGMQALLSTWRERLFYISKSIRSPAQVLEFWNLRLDDLRDRLTRSIETLLSNSSHQIALFKNQLMAYSPLLPLQRGYAFVLKNGKPVRSIEEVNSKDILSLQLSDGRIEVEVKSKILEQ